MHGAHARSRRYSPTSGLNSFRSASVTTLEFNSPIEDGLTVNMENPEQAVAYDERRVRDWYGANDLRIDAPLFFGSWCGREGCASFQDIVVAKQASASPD